MVNAQCIRRITCVVSVVLCTHNPRSVHLNRVLAGLRAQTLPQPQWELVIVDNRSEEPVASRYSVAWHPRARIVREETLGLAAARARGIADATEDVLVFVDDDNVLAPDYLLNAASIGRAYPYLGVWGGTVRAEFEGVPPAWTKPYWPLLAIRDTDVVRWSNTLDDWRAQPVGAGICVRREVAGHFAQRLNSDPLLLLLGRRGTSLMSGEDVDLVYCTRDLGLGFGTFPQLELVHLIPEVRTTKKYLVALVESIAASNVLLAERHKRPTEQLVWWKTGIRTFMIAVSQGPQAAEFYRAQKRGALRGRRMLMDMTLGQSRSGPDPI